MKLLFSLVTALATTVSAVQATRGHVGNHRPAITVGDGPRPNPPADTSEGEPDDEQSTLDSPREMGTAHRPAGLIRGRFEPWSRRTPNKAAGLVGALYAVAFLLVPMANAGLGGEPPWLHGAIALAGLSIFGLASRLLWHWSRPKGRDVIGDAFALFVVWVGAEWLGAEVDWRWLPDPRELVLATALGLLIRRGMLWMRDDEARPVFVQVLGGFLVAALFLAD